VGRTKRSTVDVNALVAKIERLRSLSPTLGDLGDLIEEWVDRMIAGESLEELQAPGVTLSLHPLSSSLRFHSGPR
jgi:hypothetical protein